MNLKNMKPKKKESLILENNEANSDFNICDTKCKLQL